MDTTVKVLYGKQEGAVVGYNPIEAINCIFIGKEVCQLRFLGLWAAWRLFQPKILPQLQGNDHLRQHK